LTFTDFEIYNKLVKGAIAFHDIVSIIILNWKRQTERIIREEKRQNEY